MGRQTVDDAGMHEDYGSDDPNAEVNFALLEASDSDGGGQEDVHPPAIQGYDTDDGFVVADGYDSDPGMHSAISLEDQSEWTTVIVKKRKHVSPAVDRLFDEGDLDPAPCTPKKTARIHATRSGGRASSPNHYKKLGDYDEEDLPDINDTFQDHGRRYKQGSPPPSQSAASGSGARKPAPRKPAPRKPTPRKPAARKRVADKSPLPYKRPYTGPRLSRPSAADLAIFDAYEHDSSDGGLGSALDTTKQVRMKQENAAESPVQERTSSKGNIEINISTDEEDDFRPVPSQRLKFNSTGVSPAMKKLSSVSKSDSGPSPPKRQKRGMMYPLTQASASRNKRAGARASTLNGNVNQPSAQPSSLNPEGDGRIMPTPFPDDCELIQRVDQWETKVHSDVARMPEPVPGVRVKSWWTKEVPPMPNAKELVTKPGVNHLAALRILRLKSHNYFAGLVNVKISKLSTLAAGTGPRRVQIKTPDGWADAHCISLVKISVGYLLCDPPGVAPDSEAWKYKHGVRGAFISGDFDMLFGKLAAIHGHPPGIYFPYVANCCDFVTGNKSSGGGGVVAGGSVPSSLQQPAASSSSPSSFRKNYTDPIPTYDWRNVDGSDLPGVLYDLQAAPAWVGEIPTDAVCAVAYTVGLATDDHPKYAGCKSASFNLQWVGVLG